MIGIRRIRIVAGVFIIVSFLGGVSLSDLDKRFTVSLQGNNSSTALDYFMETIALTSPIIEFTSIYDLWQPGHDISHNNNIRLIARAVTTTYTATAILKYGIRRERPKRDYQPRLWNTRITPSFPSGHVASSALFATIFARYHKELTVPATIYIFASAYSQVYVGNHYLSDVIGGVILGVLVGNLAMKHSEPISTATKKPAHAPAFSLTFSFALPSRQVR